MGFKRLLTSQVMKSNDEVDMEEWADDPQHAKLVETDRSLREQEEKDTEVAMMYEEKYDKIKDPQEEEEDHEVAMMYQKLYSQNATEAQIASASTNRNLAQEVKRPWRVALENQLFRLKNMPMRVAIAGRQISEDGLTLVVHPGLRT